MAGSVNKKYYNEIFNSKYLTAEEERDLVDRTRSGCRRSKDALAQSYMKMVVSMAIKYCKGTSVDVEDAISSGAIGLSIAIDRFDPDTEVNGKKVRLSTYAAWWVRAYMVDTVAEEIVPILASGRGSSRAKRICTKITARKRAGSGVLTAEDLESIATESNCTVEEVTSVETMMAGTISLDGNKQSHGSGERDMKLHEVIPDDSIQDPDQEMDRKMVTELFERALEDLSPNERAILVGRTFAQGKPLTLKHFAESFGVSRQRIRQIEQSATDKLIKRCKELKCVS